MSSATRRLSLRLPGNGCRSSLFPILLPSRSYSPALSTASPSRLLSSSGGGGSGRAESSSGVGWCSEASCCFWGSSSDLPELLSDSLECGRFFEGPTKLSGGLE
uniref:Uncharacterized protein n=1 Tax=Cacopsylla melanoneura TaxID=428564 RepID=A0A8D9FG29_9HEMI